MSHNSRRAKLLELLDKREEKSRRPERKTTTVLFRPENIFYLTNFWGEGIAILPEDGSQIKLVVPKLEYTRATNTSRECDIVSSERGTTLTNTMINTIRENDIVFSDSDEFDTINKIQKKNGKGKHNH